MKIRDLIQEIRKGNTNNDVVIVSGKKDHGYTTDITVSWDDNGVAVIEELGDSKPY